MQDYLGPTTAYYDLLTAAVADIPFYLEEARSCGGPVLELGCGTGRVTLPLAGAGLEVVGLDRSPDMLARAEEKLAALPPEVRARVTLLQGDMRDFRLRRRFPLIIIPYRSFQCLLTPEEQRRCLTCVRRHLLPGGRLILTLLDPRPEVVAPPWSPEGMLRRVGDWELPGTDRRLLLWESRRSLPEVQQVEYFLIFSEMDAQGREITRHHVTTRLRFTCRYEMHYLLELCGFQVTALYGGYARQPFSPGGEQVWVAVLPGAKGKGIPEGGAEGQTRSTRVAAPEATRQVRDRRSGPGAGETSRKAAAPGSARRGRLISDPPGDPG